MEKLQLIAEGKPFNWTPTSENINALPDAVAQYIHSILSVEPASMVQENEMLRLDNEQLRALINNPEITHYAVIAENGDIEFTVSIEAFAVEGNPGQGEDAARSLCFEFIDEQLAAGIEEASKHVVRAIYFDATTVTGDNPILVQGNGKEHVERIHRLLRQYAELTQMQEFPEEFEAEVAEIFDVLGEPNPYMDGGEDYTDE